MKVSIIFLIIMSFSFHVKANPLLTEPKEILYMDDPRLSAFNQVKELLHEADPKDLIKYEPIFMTVETFADMALKDPDMLDFDLIKGFIRVTDKYGNLMSYTEDGFVGTVYMRPVNYIDFSSKIINKKSGAKLLNHIGADFKEYPNDFLKINQSVKLVTTMVRNELLAKQEAILKKYGNIITDLSYIGGFRVSPAFYSTPAFRDIDWIMNYGQFLGGSNSEAVVGLRSEIKDFYTDDNGIYSDHGWNGNYGATMRMKDDPLAKKISGALIIDDGNPYRLDTLNSKRGGNKVRMSFPFELSNSNLYENATLSEIQKLDASYIRSDLESRSLINFLSENYKNGPESSKNPLERYYLSIYSNAYFRSDEAFNVELYLKPVFNKAVITYLPESSDPGKGLTK